MTKDEASRLEKIQCAVLRDSGVNFEDAYADRAWLLDQYLILNGRVRWISVDDTKPDYDKCVLLTARHGEQRPFVLEGVRALTDCTGEHYEYPMGRARIRARVTHWMSLPEPPEEVT